MDRPKVLVIAGYDQSAGAGLLSDIKTLEAHGVYGYGVCTGMTFQNERALRRVEWLSPEQIVEQIDLCFDSSPFPWVKIGITPSIRIASKLVDHLKRRNPVVRVLLDPVIRSSSGTGFWDQTDTEEWEALAARCFVVTPNWDEIRWLYPGEDVSGRCADLSLRSGCQIYLKGGHHAGSPGRDYLWSAGAVQVLEAEEGVYSPKHGSGCVLSSALTANLALGYALPEAALRAKRYIEKFLASNNTLLGWH